MRLRLPTLAAVTFAFAACGGGGGGGGMAYAVPSTPTVTYMLGDTTVIDIDAGGQQMQVSQASAVTMTASFASGSGGVEVTLTVVDFDGRMSQPMGAPITANESGIDGPIVLTLDAMGNVTVGSLPNVSGNAEALFGPLSTAHTFFPGMPGGSVSAGATWSDTISFSGSEGMGEIEASAVLDYAAVGDTVVDGRTLMKIDVTGHMESGAASNMQGMDVYQSISASLTGHVLWDAQAGIMYERFSSVEGTGSVEVAVAPQPMGVAVRGTSWARIAN